MKRIFLSFVVVVFTLLGCGINEPQEPTVQWENTYGAWTSTNSIRAWSFDDQLQPSSYRPTTYYYFSPTQVFLYDEEWNWNETNWSWEYFSTRVYFAKTMHIQEAGKYSTDEGKEVVSLYFTRMTRGTVTNEWTPVNSYSQLLNLVLLSYSGDTLVIGFCDSYDCGGNQFHNTGHYETDTLVRVQEFDELKNSWWLY